MVTNLSKQQRAKTLSQASEHYTFCVIVIIFIKQNKLTFWARIRIKVLKYKRTFILLFSSRKSVSVWKKKIKIKGSWISNKNWFNISEKLIMWYVDIFVLQDKTFDFFNLQQKQRYNVGKCRKKKTIFTVSYSYFCVWYLVANCWYLLFSY